MTPRHLAPQRLDKLKLNVILPNLFLLDDGMWCTLQRSQQAAAAEAQGRRLPNARVYVRSLLAAERLRIKQTYVLQQIDVQLEFSARGGSRNKRRAKEATRAIFPVLPLPLPLPRRKPAGTVNS